MSSTLYRKYRPATFSEVIGQKHVVQTLKNAIKSGRIGQAYLFAGPRGTGKTSIARIFAKTVNCDRLKNGEPCIKCNSCKLIAEGRALDIIEIDAASNTGVDNIRELRETVKLPPSLFKYKVYIIDEVHMLSGGAFNALLKTLEEPPSHVIFILATTEVHKIPETILSRVQRFDFTRLTIPEIVKRLDELAKLEKVKVDREALEIIAAHSEGGMRNAESLMGQIIALEDKKITAEEVQFILGTASEKITEEFIDSILENNLKLAFENIINLRESGIDFKNFAKTLLQYFRQMLVLKINPDLGEKLSYEITPERLKKIKGQMERIDLQKILCFIDKLQKNIELFRNSPIPHLYLEVTLASLSESNRASMSPDLRAPLPQKVINNSNKENLVPEKKNATDSEISKNSEKIEQPQTNPKKIVSMEDLDLVLTNWPSIIDSLKSYNHSLSSVLKMAQPSLIEGNYLIIKTKYSFYNDKITETTNRLTIEDVIDKITGVKLRIKALTEKEFKENYGDIKQDKSLLQEAMEIFGGKIIRE
jgi:DNA polymerase III subunit gamma/tau